MALHSRRDSHESALLRAGLTLKRKDGKAIVVVGDRAALVPREVAPEPAADTPADAAAQDAAAEHQAGSPGAPASPPGDRSRG